MDEYSYLEEMGVARVNAPSRYRFRPVARFQDIQAPYYPKNEEYHKRVSWVNHQINQSESSDQIGSHYRLLHPAFGFDSQHHLEAFLAHQTQMRKTNTPYYAMDIETVGDTKGNFAVSEISITGFGANKLPNGERLNLLVKLEDQDTIKHLQSLIDRVKKDRFAFRSLTPFEQRQLVDLMRYSTSGPTAAQLKGEVKHNEIVKEAFNQAEEIKTWHVVQNVTRYLPHMEQGLQDLQTHGVKLEKAIEKYNQFIRKQPDAFMVTQNGEDFDLPNLKKAADKIGVELAPVKNHVDLLRVIQSAYAYDPDVFHEELGRPYGEKFLKGRYSQFELARSIGMSVDDLHNAGVDTTVLGHIYAKAGEVLEKRIEESKVQVKGPHLPLRDPYLQWDDRPLQVGQKLFAVKGAGARKDDLSYQAVYQDGKYEPHMEGFNEVIVNSRTVYEFKGQRDLSDDKTKRLAWELYDAHNNRSVMLVREGDHAEQQLRAFVQGHFYDAELLDPKFLRENEKVVREDLARREYERMFTFDKAGYGRGGGFAKASILYRNAELVQQRRQTKTKYLMEDIKQEEWYQKWSGNKEELDARVQEELRRRRLSHEAVQNFIDFNFLWDEEKEEYVDHPQLRKHFDVMKNRLISELPVYMPAIEAIENAFGEEDAQLRDLAWHEFNQRVEQEIGRHTKTRAALPYESRALTFRDSYSKEERVINFLDPDTAKWGINRYLEEGMDNEWDEERKRTYKLNRLGNFLDTLEEQGMRKAPMKVLRGQYLSNNNPMDTIKSIVNELMDKRNQSMIERDSIEVHSMAARDTSSLVEGQMDEMVKESIAYAKRLSAAYTGGKMIFHENPALNELFDHLDDLHESGIDPQHRASIERFLGQVEKEFNNKGKFYHYQMLLNEDRTQAKLVLYEKKHSASVEKALQSGKPTDKTVEFLLPFINRDGTHEIGNLKLNAFTIMDYEYKGDQPKGKVVKRSTFEEIMRNYEGVLSRVHADMVKGNYESANHRTRRNLNDSRESFSTIQGNLDYNELKYTQTADDLNKQSNVSIQRAMIKDMYAKGLLKDRDFYNLNEIRKPNGQLVDDVGLEHIKREKHQELYMRAPEWAAEHGEQLHYNAVKDNKASALTLGRINMNEYVPFGEYDRPGRPNPIQAQRNHQIEKEVRKNLLELQKENMYLHFNPMVTTTKQWERDQLNRAAGQYDSVYVKMAYMNQEQIYQRIKEIAEGTDENLKQVLREDGILHSDGTIDPIRMPRVYEQQAIFNRQFLDAYQVKGQKKLDMGDQPEQFKFADGVGKGSILKPGDVIGYIEGDKKNPLTWNKGYDGTIEDIGDRILMSWQEPANKFSLNREKVTKHLGYSQETIEAISQVKGAVGIYAPNFGKREDYSALLEAQANILQEHVNGLKGRAKLRAINRIEQDLPQLKWNKQNNFFEYVGSGETIQASTLTELMEHLQIDQDGTAYGIVQAKAMKVFDDTYVSDEAGRATLDFDEEGKPIYRSQERKGTRLGHREMMIFENRGLKHTYDYVREVMKTQAKEAKGLNQVRNIDLFRGLEKSFRGYVDDSFDQDHLIKLDDWVDSHKFKTLPDLDRTEIAFKGTLLDKQHVEKFMREDGKYPLHGVWLEMPHVEASDGTKLELKNRDGKSINKVYLPFTQIQGVGDQAFLNDIERANADIIRRAREVTQAKDQKEAMDSFERLQQSIDHHIDRTNYELRSSKGFAATQVHTAEMARSGYLDIKVIPMEQQKQLGGDFLVVSSDVAKRMGAYDYILGEHGEKALEDMSLQTDAHVMFERYPAFHNDAIQFARLRIDPTLTGNEIHATASIADFMNADSDGDRGAPVFIGDEQVQNEWRQKRSHQERNRVIDDAEYEQGYKYRLSELTNEVKPFEANQAEEIIRKTGKSYIGLLSNWNLKMRRLLQAYGDEIPQEAYHSIEAFTRNVEENPISAKHARAADFESGAYRLYKALNEGKWDEVERVDQQYFGGDFMDKYGMREAKPWLSKMTSQFQEVNTQNPTLSVYTSYGVNLDRMSQEDLANFYQGKYDGGIYGHTAMNMILEDLEVESPNPHELHPVKPLEDYHVIDYTKRPDQGTRVGNYVQDGTGGWVKGGVKAKVDDMVRTFWDGPNGTRNKILTGLAGLAMGGAIAYNTLSESEPVVPLSAQYNQQGIQPAPTSAPVAQQRPPSSPLPDLPQEQRSASIQVSGRGSGQVKQQLSPLVQQGMAQSGYQSPTTNMNVKVQDNTQKLRPHWYRDQVESNI